MLHSRFTLLGAIALFLAATTSPLAQQNDKPRKAPKQTPDRGVDAPGDRDDDRNLVVGTRQSGGVTVTRRGDGVLVATLDETFHDALVATRGADGRIAYTCMHGLPAASAHVKALTKPVAKPTTRAEGR